MRAGCRGGCRWSCALVSLALRHVAAHSNAQGSWRRGGAHSVNCGCELPPSTTMLRTMAPVGAEVGCWQSPVRKGQGRAGRAGLQRKTSRGVGGARARARAGQVMGLVAVAERLFQELGSMVDNTSLRCTQTNFSNPSASRWTDLESKTVTGITQF